jgi:hypothetical protein
MNRSISGYNVPISFSNSKNYLFLFLLWPFLSFFVALVNFNQKDARKVVYIFLVYYGLTFVIGSEGLDSAGYAMKFRANAQLPFSDFFKIVGGIYAMDTSVDVIEPLISFLVSRVTDNHRVLFAAYAAIFGFFYLKSINLLYTRYHTNPGWNAAIFLAFFTILIPITSINGFRFWTAAWIFFFGAYHVIMFHDARYLLIALGSALVHFSFLSANAVLVIFFLAGNRNYIYLPIALISFVLPQVFSSTFQLISLKLGGGLQSRYENYSSEAYMSYRQENFEQAAWFLQIGNKLVLYYLLFAVIATQFDKRNLIKDKPEKSLFSFLLLFLSFVNFGKAIPSFGGRFQIVFFLFATLLVFLYSIKLSGNKINYLTSIGLFPILLYSVVEFRQVSEMISAWILMPGLGLPLAVPTLSIADILFR